MTEEHADPEVRPSVDAEVVVPLDSGERKDLIGLGVLAAAWAVVPALFGFWLLAEIGWVSDQYARIEIERGLFMAVGAYAVLFGITAGLGLLPTYAQAFLGGWAFGAVYGTIGAMLGILLLSLIHI